MGPVSNRPVQPGRLETGPTPNLPTLPIVPAADMAGTSGRPGGDRAGGVHFYDTVVPTPAPP